MQRFNPKSSLAFRRLVVLELQRTAKQGIAFVCCGIVLPLAAARFRSDSLPLLVVALLVTVSTPMSISFGTSLKDRLSGDLEFLKALPVTGYVHARARAVVGLLYALVAVALVSPYLWPGYLWIGGEEPTGFALAASGLCFVLWVATCLCSAITLRFGTERLMMWGLMGLVAFIFVGEFVGERLLDPLLAPYLNMETPSSVVDWLRSPLAIVALIAALPAVSALLIAISLRWTRTAIETYRREDKIMSL